MFGNIYSSSPRKDTNANGHVLQFRLYSLDVGENKLQDAQTCFPALQYSLIIAEIIDGLHDSFSPKKPAQCVEEV